MQEMKFSLVGAEAVTLTGHEIDKLLRAGDGDAALLYLYIRKTHGRKSDYDAAKDLDKSKGWVASASAILSQSGLIRIDTSESAEAKTNQATAGKIDETLKPLAEPRQYTAEEVTKEIAADNNFSNIVDETQRKLGKILSADELVRLFGIYDNLRIPPEVIFQLITHCISECRRTGDGRAPSMRYIEKAAYTWARESIFSLERAEEYLKELEKRREMRGEIKRVLCIRNREFSATEKKFTDAWIDMGMQPDAIAVAYDKTLVKTGAMTWPYIDKIIKNWHNKGLLTERQVLESEGKKKTGNAGAGGAVNYRRGSKNAEKKHGEPNREEIARMNRLLNKIQEGET